MKDAHGGMMIEARMRHLELIQTVIGRLAQNSFVYKGWAVTVAAAILALGGRDACPQYMVVALVPTMVFWGLDGYYLRQERLFRKLYKAVRLAALSEMETDPFTMDTSPYRSQVRWLASCLSPTIAWLYIAIIVGTAFVAAAWR